MNLKKILIPAVALIVVLALGVFVGSKLFGKPIELPEVAEVVVEDNSREVVAAITRTEEISLLSMHIEGIRERSQKSQLLGLDIPGSDRAIFIQFTFNAKLGIDGSEVLIEEISDDAYIITIPSFIFIGHDDVELRTATEKNGALSWVTPEIDTLDMANEILSGEVQQRYIDANDALLREQAAAFYNGIVKAIDPQIKLHFVFESHPDADADANSIVP